MAFNPMDFFNAGGDVGKANKSPFAYGAENMFDQFKSDREIQNKIMGTLGTEMAMANYKDTLERNRPISELDKQKIAESKAKQSLMSGGIDPDNPQAIRPGEGLSGQSYLDAAVPRQYHDTVKNIANMTQTANDVSLRGTNPMIRAQMNTWATKYRPEFNPQNRDAFQTLKKDYTVGDPAKATRSLNAALQHMGTLHTQLNDIHEKNKSIGNMPFINQLVLRAESAIGKGDFAEVNKTTKTLAIEVPKALRGTGMVAEEDIARWEHEFGASQSPEQLERGLKSATQLLGGQLQSRTGFYRETAKRLGVPEDQQSLPEDVAILPETKNALQKAGLYENMRKNLGYGQDSNNPLQQAASDSGNDDNLVAQALRTHTDPAQQKAILATYKQRTGRDYGQQ